MITGATSGIGLATAESLARLGARVVLVGRDRARGEAALARVNAIGDVKAKLFLADLWFTTEVRRLASDLSAALPSRSLLATASLSSVDAIEKISSVRGDHDLITVFGFMKRFPVEFSLALPLSYGVPKWYAPRP